MGYFAGIYGCRDDGTVLDDCRYTAEMPGE
jgi:hypothetical protein